MHRLFPLKIASSNFSKRLNNNVASLTLLHSHNPINAFTSLYKSNLRSFHYQNLNSITSLKNPIPHFTLSQPHLSLPTKTPRSLSNSFLSRRVFSNLSNSTKRAAAKSFVDCKVGLLKPGFARSYSGFNFNRNFGGYYRRGWRSWLPRLSEDSVVLWLILANVAVFMLWRVADPRLMVRNFMISLDNFESGRIHTLVTSAFSHRDTWHLASNMVGLYFFGSTIARTFGPEYLVKLYLAGAIGGSVFYLAHHAYLALTSKRQGIWGRDPSRTPGLGASGAVNAIMLLDIFLNPKATLYFDFIIPVPAMLLGIFLIGKDMLRIIQGDSEVSGSAHLGGVAVAAMAWYRIRKGRF